MAKYAATVAVKLLILIEGEEERETMRRKKKNINHCFAVWLDADARWNDDSNRKFPSDHCVLVFPEKKHRVDNASVSDICRYGVVCGCVHFDGCGGEFGKNRCGCHLTRDKVLLYKICGCYVIINQTSYTRVLSIV